MHTIAVRSPGGERYWLWLGHNLQHHRTTLHAYYRSGIIVTLAFATILFLLQLAHATRIHRRIRNLVQHMERLRAGDFSSLRFDACHRLWLCSREGLLEVLPGIGTVPLTNLAGWLLAGLVLMTLLDLLVERTATPPAVGDGAPLLAMAWMTLGGALAHAGWLGLPGSAAWGAGLGVAVLAVLAVQRSRLP